jgi:hypothetical protein
LFCKDPPKSFCKHHLPPPTARLIPHPQVPTSPPVQTLTPLSHSLSPPPLPCRGRGAQRRRPRTPRAASATMFHHLSPPRPALTRPGPSSDPPTTTAAPVTLPALDSPPHAAALVGPRPHPPRWRWWAQAGRRLWGSRWCPSGLIARGQPGHTAVVALLPALEQSRHGWI